ncbi:hypothetical protein LDH33_15915 [Mycobacterium tuberculosis]|uniref:hypothetical protein n=1 Tax=Mycobacterium tuberculosis TaxID=1773 RepID=UPI001E508E67|nr:hypothetical protein [Mycobacterium tuberculosis]UDU02066.1 hypothetical protein LDH33_15915 [Mycobacterium tuberculosis]
MPIASAALRRARRVGTIGLVPIASAALRRARRVGTIGLSADRKRGASAGRGGSAPSG